MEKKQKKRSEINDKYKWDLSKIYGSKKEFDKDFELASKLSKKIAKFEKEELDSSKKLYDLLSLNGKLDRILSKLFLFSELQVCSDATNSSYQELNGRVGNLYTSILTEISFIENKILKIDDHKMKEFLNNKLLSDYKFYLKNLLKGKKHMIPDSEEKLIATLSKSFSTGSDAYDMLVDGDMKFGFIKDEKGKEVELTNSNYFIYSKSENRLVREKAFKKFYETYGNYSNTLAVLYNSHLEAGTTISRLHKYKSILDEELEVDNLKPDIYDNLIKTINKDLKSLHKYYKTKKNSLNINDFHIYDTSAPIKESKLKYTFEEAKDIVLDVFKIMGEDYTSILEKAFNEKWIDVYNNVGKRSGAFSTGIYDADPYVLLNFEGKVEDLSTIAHELGHAVNTYFSKKNNFYLYYDCSLFMAEIASLTNEIVFNTKMIERQKDNNEKLNIINNLISLFNSNLFDATLCAEFELDAHKKIENNEVITADYLNNLYLKLNEKYYGKDVIVDPEIKYRWERFSHLFVDYYLFKYATGISCACFCASKILNEDKKFIEKYKKFLKIGSSKYPKDALKTIGIDISNKEFIEEAIKFYDKLIEDYKEVYEEIK